MKSDLKDMAPFFGALINFKYYLNLLCHLKKNIREKRFVLRTKKIFFYQYNKCPYKCDNNEKPNAMKYDLLKYPFYSFDLAPSSVRVFSQIFLRRKRFSTKEDEKASSNGNFKGLKKTHYCNGFGISMDKVHCI